MVKDKITLYLILIIYNYFMFCFIINKMRNGMINLEKNRKKREREIE